MRHQKGYTLLELILVIGLLASMTILSFQEKSLEIEQKKAVAIGQEILQYNNAVRSWISKNPSATPAIYTSTDWLKPTSCGGLQTFEYLSCDAQSFSATKPHHFGQVRIQTTISNNAGKITALSIASPIHIDKVRSDLSGLAAISAASGSMGHTPSDASYKANPFDGTIAFSASNIAMNDVWLRTDGSNYMNNNISFNPSIPAASRGINGVSRLQSFIGEVLYLGEANGAIKAAPERTIVDSNAEIYGNLVIENKKSTLTGIELVSGDIRASNGNVISTKSFIGQEFIDADNNSFFVNPGAMSRINNLDIEGNLEVKTNFTSSGTSLLKSDVKMEKDLLFTNVVTKNAGCGTEGAFSRATDSTLAVCKSGIWQSGVPGAMAGGFRKWTWGGCAVANKYTGSCSCPSGSYLFLSGQAYMYSQWDLTIYMCIIEP